MGRRRDKLDKRLANAIVTRQCNSLKKTKERLRREKQMLELLKQGQLPYTPPIMSWLSSQLGKKSSKITANDVKTMIA